MKIYIFIIVIIQTLALASCITIGNKQKVTMRNHASKYNYNQQGIGERNIVLIHGIGSSKETWNDTLKHFSPDKYTVYTLDLLGHGSHYHIEDRLTPTRQAEFVAEFLREKNVKNPVVVGHSYGGIVSTILRINQDKLGVNLDKVILINAPIFLTDFPLFIKYYRKDWLSALMNLFTTPKFRVKYSLRHIYVDNSKISPAILEMYLLNSTDSERVQGIRNTAKSILVKELAPYLLRYKEINDPILFIRTNQDIVTPQVILVEFQTAFTNAMVRTLDQCGHNAQEECPKKIARIILEEIK